jgi:hypothetical protein
MKTVYVKWEDGKPSIDEEIDGLPYIMDLSRMTDDQIEQAKNADLLTDYDEFIYHCNSVARMDSTVQLEALQAMAQAIGKYLEETNPDGTPTPAEVALDKITRLARE